MKTLSRISIVLATFFAASAFAKTTIPLTESIDLEGIERIEFSIFSGSIEVLGGETDKLNLSIEQIANTNDEPEAEEWIGEIEKTIEAKGSTLYVSFRHPNNKTSSTWRNLFNSNKCSLEAQIRLPSHLDMKVHTRGGNISAERLSGNLDIHTSGGNLNFKDIGGPLKGHTSGGNINATLLEGITTLQTSGGHIKVDTALSRLNLNTSGGHITIHDTSAPVNARTSGGHIKARFANGFSENSVLKTSGGNISASVPSDHAFDLKANTSGGGVHLDDGLSLNGEKKRNSASGSVNGGGPRLELRTSGGNINISAI